MLGLPAYRAAELLPELVVALPFCGRNCSPGLLAGHHVRTVQELYQAGVSPCRDLEVFQRVFNARVVPRLLLEVADPWVELLEYLVVGDGVGLQQPHNLAYLRLNSDGGARRKLYGQPGLIQVALRKARAQLLLVFRVQFVQPLRHDDLRVLLRELLADRVADHIVHLGHQVEDIQHIGVDGIVVGIYAQPLPAEGHVVVDRDELGGFEALLVLVELQNLVIRLRVARTHQQRADEQSGEVAHVYCLDYFPLVYNLAEVLALDLVRG